MLQSQRTSPEKNNKLSVSTEPHIRNLIAACSAITVFGLAFGMTYPLLSLLLEIRGVASDVIGTNAAMMPLGILVCSPLIPLFTARLGSKKLAIVAALLTAIITLLYKVFDHVSVWFLLRFLQGMSIAILFVLSEAWIIGFAGNKHRGKVVALYASLLSASFGAGPALIGTIGVEGWTPFVLGATILAIGVTPLFLMQEDLVTTESTANSTSFLAFIPKAPMLIAAVGAFAIFDAAALSLFPIYGMRNGLDVSTAAWALTALILGNVFLQYPIGWLADLFSARRVLTACAAVTALLTLSVPVVINTIWMWPVLIVAGATGYGVYTTALKSLGDRFTGQDLISGTSAFGAVWGVGALLGALLGGVAIEISSTFGLPSLLAAVYAVLVCGLLIRARSPSVSVQAHDKLPQPQPD